ncbi:MAG: SH3 domain-containing protein [Gemmatimonadetes bacterium]|nr:SH3 domain-containing protein [Gemmatimonadota bacterium]
MRLLRSLLFVVTVALAGSPMGAQGRATRDAEVRATPDGNVIATVQSGTTWRTNGVRGGFTRATLEGWIDASRLGAGRDSFPASIGGTGTLRLRAEPSLNGRILAVFEAGAGIRVLERRGDWARIRRDGWIPTSAIAARAQPATAAPVPTEPEEPATAPARDGALRASKALPLSLAPGTTAIGSLDAGAVVDPIARDRGWVRVRVEAWVPESLLVPADSSYQAALTAADLRLDPERVRGRIVRWQVQVIGLQTADGLRRALVPDEPYLLAMGPSGENAMLYLAVPPALLEQSRAIAPLTNVTVTARVRNGRSQPTGAPVLDLLSIVKR